MSKHYKDTKTQIQSQLTAAMESTTRRRLAVITAPPPAPSEGERLTMAKYRSRAIAAMVPVDTIMLAPCGVRGY